MEHVLKERFAHRKGSVAVIGLGYVGLPIAMGLIKKDWHVLGVDISEEKVAALGRGESYIIDVPQQEVVEALAKGMRLESTYAHIGEADAILICVPTPLTKSKEPDLSYIIKSMDGISQYMTKETLIVLESTTYPGTTDELITKRIEQEKGFQIGEDFFVCYSPERVDPGNALFNVMNTAKVLGGTTAMCLTLGKLLYESFLPHVVCVSSTRVAEMSKLLENTFRCINIALVNEMAMMCERMGIDIWEVIKGASSKPFGFMPFYPGPGIGGHCIPLDPLYLSWEGKKYNFFNRFIELASDVNGNMPHYVVRQAQDILNTVAKGLNGSQIMLMGMAYKKNIDDLRESPALEVYELLRKKGAEVTFYDPYVKCFKRDEVCVQGVEWSIERISKQDLIIILTDHEGVDYEVLAQYAPIIYDTRNAMKNIKSDKVVLLGQSCEVSKKV